MTTTQSKHTRKRQLAAVIILLAFAPLEASTQAKEITVPSGRIRTIQQAVDAAAPGDTVIVLRGSYSDLAAIQSLNPVVGIGPTKSGLKLKAAGPAGSVKIVGPGYGTGISVQADNVRIEGFDISGFAVGLAGGGSQTQGTQITRNTIHDCSAACITLTGSNHYEIDNNVLEGGENGIFLNGWPGAGPNTDHHIHHNLVSNALGQGIFLWLSPGCALDHNETTNNGQFGIYLSSSPNGAVNHNETASNASGGLLLGNSPNCVVAHNDADGNGVWGIAVGGSCGSVFEHNSAEANGEWDLFAPDWESPATCNAYRRNRAGTAAPSLDLWDVK